MNDGIKEISDKLDSMRQEYRKDRYESTSYILWGFTLAMVGLTVAFFHPINVVAVILFFIMGWVMWFRARRVTASQKSMNEK
jgi:Flp pilus assembly protein TadB